MVGALVVGSVVAIVSAIGIASGLLRLAGGGVAGAKSVTAPVATWRSANLGGLPALTAALVITTGIIGAMVVTPTMNARHPRLGGARLRRQARQSRSSARREAFMSYPIAVFAGIAMRLNAIVTAILVPVIVGLLP